MTDHHDDPATDADDAFVWHPEYAGRTFESVERALTDDIKRDQKSYHATLENAEKEEFGAFNSVRELEKRWSGYDFGWFDVPAPALARRIMDFERARENGQELFTFDEWRARQPLDKREAESIATESSPAKSGDWRENLTDEQRRRLASALSIGVIVLMLLICIVLFTIIR